MPYQPGRPGDAQHARLEAVDLYRGLIMLVMALDHARHLVGANLYAGSELWSGVDFTGVGPALLTTRVLTHVCAAGFALLMGLGMTYTHDRRTREGMGFWVSRRCFLLRGMFLVALQFTLENLVWALGGVIGEPVEAYFGVLAMLGAAMAFGSLLLGRSARVLIGVGVGCLFAGWLVIWTANPETAFAPAWRIIALPGITESFMVYYPVLPWLGVVLLGMALGRLIKDFGENAWRPLAWAGAVLLALFVSFRLAGIGTLVEVPGPLATGDPWSVLHVVKYPPSPVYCCLTIGVALVTMAGFRAMRAGETALLRPIVAVGRAPLFFYLAHLYLFLAAGAVFAAQPLAGVYAIWAAGLVILVPATAAYGRFRSRRPAGSVWRLL
jgi:uncharacterized membrane protein